MLSPKQHPLRIGKVGDKLIVRLVRDSTFGPTSSWQNGLFHLRLKGDPLQGIDNVDNRNPVRILEINPRRYYSRPGDQRHLLPVPHRRFEGVHREVLLVHPAWVHSSAVRRLAEAADARGDGVPIP